MYITPHRNDYFLIGFTVPPASAPALWLALYISSFVKIACDIHTPKHIGHLNGKKENQFSQIPQIGRALKMYFWEW